MSDYLPCARRLHALLRDRRLQLDAWADGDHEAGNALSDRNPDLARYNEEYVRSVADPDALVRIFAAIIAEEAGKVSGEKMRALAASIWEPHW